MLEAAREAHLKRRGRAQAQAAARAGGKEVTSTEATAGGVARPKLKMRNRIKTTNPETLRSGHRVWSSPIAGADDDYDDDLMGWAEGDAEGASVPDVL